MITEAPLFERTHMKTRKRYEVLKDEARPLFAQGMMIGAVARRIHCGSPTAQQIFDEIKAESNAAPKNPDAETEQLFDALYTRFSFAQKKMAIMAVVTSPVG